MQYQLDSLDGVDESIASQYEEKDGVFILKIEGGPDSDAEIKRLRAAKDKLLSEAKVAKEKARAAEEAEAAKEEERLTAATELAKKNGDLEALTKAMADQQAAKDRKLQALEKSLSAETTGKLAVTLAGRLANDGAADILLPHIEKRLKSSFVDGVPKTLILDEKGTETSLTVDDLVTEINANPKFAPILKGSSGSGSGVTITPGRAGGLGDKPIKEMTSDEKSDFIAQHGLDAWNKKLSAGN